MLSEGGKKVWTGLEASEGRHFCYSDGDRELALLRVIEKEGLIGTFMILVLINFR